MNLNAMVGARETSSPTFYLTDPAERVPRPSEDSEGVWSRIIDPAVETWLLDHCPTYVVPVVPMMGVVAELIQAADDERMVHSLVRLENLELNSWLRLDQGAIELVFKDRELQDGRVFTEIFRRETVKAGLLRVGQAVRGFPAPGWPPVEAWGIPQGARLVEDPYGAGGLFHGGAFQVVDGLRRSPRESWFVLDCGELRQRAGGDPTILLDGILHGIPHAFPQVWFGEAAADVSAFPYRLERLDLHQPLPDEGLVTIISRALAMPTPRTIRLGVQVLRDGEVIMDLALIEALMPMIEYSPIRMKDRRRFARDREFMPGWRIADHRDGRSVLEVASVKRLNWLPGTLEAIYGISGHGRALVQEIAIMDHFALRHGVHPSRVRIGPKEIVVGERDVHRRDRIHERWIGEEQYEVSDS